MSFTKQTLRDISVASKTILLRADFDAALLDDGTPDPRLIERSVSTIRALIDKNATVVIISSWSVRDEYNRPASLRPIGLILARLLDRPIRFVDTCSGPRARLTTKLCSPGSIILYENLFLKPAEKKNSETFAQSIVRASGADYYVQDALSLLDKNYTSMVSIAHLLPTVAGVAFEQEYTLLHSVRSVKKKKIAIIGGNATARVLAQIEMLVDCVDMIILTGEVMRAFSTYRTIGPKGQTVDTSTSRALAAIFKRAEQKVGLSAIDTLFYLPFDNMVQPKNKTTPPANVLLADVLPYHTITGLGKGSLHEIIAYIEQAGAVILCGDLGTDLSTITQIGRAIKARKLSARTIVIGARVCQGVYGWDRSRGAHFSYFDKRARSPLAILAHKETRAFRSLLDARPQIRYTKRKEA